MRIISGKHKGRAIRMPKDIRPTQAKVRKALFDILGDIQGLSFLELFAGSGAVGLEAASYGAEEVVFVEQDRSCLEKLKQNLDALGRSGLRVIGMEASRAIKLFFKEGKKFELIFLDPPYYKGENEPLTKKTLQMLGGYDILAPNGIAAVQHFKKDNLPDSAGDLVLFKQSKYGDTFLSFYRKV